MSVISLIVQASEFFTKVLINITICIWQRNCSVEYVLHACTCTRVLHWKLYIYIFPDEFCHEFSGKLKLHKLGLNSVSAGLAALAHDTTFLFRSLKGSQLQTSTDSFRVDLNCLNDVSRNLNKRSRWWTTYHCGPFHTTCSYESKW